MSVEYMNRMIVGIIDWTRLFLWILPAMYLSIALHELAHYFSCLALNIPVKEVSLFAGKWTHTFQGNTDWIIGFSASGSNHVMPANPEMQALSALLIIFAGPLVNIIIAVIAWMKIDFDNNVIIAFFTANLSLVLTGLYPSGGTDGHQFLQVATGIYQYYFD